LQIEQTFLLRQLEELELLGELEEQMEELELLGELKEQIQYTHSEQRRVRFDRGRNRYHMRTRCAVGASQ